MSNLLPEKIRLIRDSNGMSRQAFADEIGISARTIEGIENKGKTPGGDVLLKVAKRWPMYALWLLTDSVEPPSQLKPLMDEFNVIRICDRLCRPSPEETNFMVNPDWFEKVLFVQSISDASRMECLILLKTEPMPMLKQAVLISDDLTWPSQDSGMKGLRRLAGYLSMVGREDLIRTSELRIVEDHYIDYLYERSEISEKALILPDIGESNVLKKTHLNFSAWRHQGKDYDPKYGWQDFK
ncbi:helix-turn-helix domain-containing protein [Bacterioplanoides pacificum]|uniref:Helix-turn-helix domain-containing protein n=1 Tax=Bacterioplanoides pacificum TaxID=1171596 RepID=A0ABV7VWL1_9GAMM